MPTLDSDGQPLATLNRPRRMSRDKSELMGVLKGIVADGYVANNEIVELAVPTTTCGGFPVVPPSSLRPLSVIGVTDLSLSSRIREQKCSGNREPGGGHRT